MLFDLNERKRNNFYSYRLTEVTTNDRIDRDIPGRFSTILFKEDSLFLFLFAVLHTIPFMKGIYSKMNMPLIGGGAGGGGGGGRGAGAGRVVEG